MSIMSRSGPRLAGWKVLLPSAKMYLVTSLLVSSMQLFGYAVLARIQLDRHSGALWPWVVLAAGIGIAGGTCTLCVLAALSMRQAAWIVPELNRLCLAQLLSLALVVASFLIAR